MAGDPDDRGLFAALTASNEHIVRMLDLLSESGCTTALLMRFVPGPTAALSGALRLLAVHGLLTSDDDGSWDEPLMIRGSIRLTGRGEAVAQGLAESATTAVAQDDRRPRRHTRLNIAGASSDRARPASAPRS